jgi:phage shock protein E
MLCQCARLDPADDVARLHPRTHAWRLGTKPVDRERVCQADANLTVPSSGLAHAGPPPPRILRYGWFMQSWRALAVVCRRVLVVPAAISLALLGCASNSEPCEDCDQALTGTGGASVASASGGASVAPSTGGAPYVDAGAGTGGVLSAAGGPTSSGAGGTSAASATGGASVTPGTGGTAVVDAGASSGGAPDVDASANSGGVPNAAGGPTSSGAGGTSAASATGGASVTPGTGGTAVVDAGASSGGVPDAAGGTTNLTGGSPATGPERCSRVDGPTAESLVEQGALLLDVRTAEEYAGGHAQGALNIPVEELSGRIGELPTDRAIIVYCRSGSRSSQANTLLCDQGFDVYDLGAYSNWTGA